MADEYLNKTGLSRFWDKIKTKIPDITGKADKVSNATNGNFAGLDSNGNLTDSGSKSSDFKAANAHDSWSDVTSKPFNTLGSLFYSDNGALSASYVPIVAIERAASKGEQTGGSPVVGYRAIKATKRNNDGTTSNTYGCVDYVMTQTATATTYTFTHPIIIPETYDWLIDVYSSIFGEVPISVSQTGSSANPGDTIRVTFSESKARTVAIKFT